MNIGFEPRRKGRKPLDPASLEALAVHYVGRYATTREKLLRYLNRKIGERGWAEATPPAAEALADRMVSLGYVNDRIFAEGRARSLSRRGYGTRRIVQTLAVDGIDPSLRAEALEDFDAMAAAVALARRRRLGPYDDKPATPDSRRKAVAILVRAGHDPSLARRVALAETVEQLENGD